MTKENNAEIEQAEFQLSQLMASTETQSFQRAGTLFYLTTKTYASADKAHKDELFKALQVLRVMAHLSQRTLTQIPCLLL